jgi:hypothetical protein
MVFTENMLKNILGIALFNFLVIFNLYPQNRVFTGNVAIDSYGNSVYEFNLGKYHILQYRANMREEPSRNSDVIAIMSFNDEIEILENTRISEEINNVQAYWYKIKYGNITGYTFGGNIAVETLVNNNIICFYRVSRMREVSEEAYHENYKYQNDILPNDIFIYI